VVKRVLALLAGLAAACLGISAQAHNHTPPPSGKEVDLAKLPAPEKLTGIGIAHIQITTKSLKAQQWFDQGLALMHCFWDYEALRAFNQAARLDPDCAMCHLGLYRALLFGGREQQAKEQLAKAKELSDKASDREQRYIRAYVAGDHNSGAAADSGFQKEMEALVERYPDDLEAKLELALGVGRGYDPKTGDPRPGTLYNRAILRDLRYDYPDDAAVNHYWIHAMEVTSHPELAIQSAEILAALAPSSGHMVHMPGHIFYRMGDYERARTSFLQAMKVDQEYMAKQHVSVKDDWNYAHNLSYLIADCAEEGRYQEAREHAQTLAALTSQLADTRNPGFYVIQIASTEARLAIRFGDWQDVVDHPLHLTPDPDQPAWITDYSVGLAGYARAMQLLENKNLQQAQSQADLLDATLWRMSQLDLKDRDSDARDRTVNLLATASLELQGEIAFANHNFASGSKLFQEAEKREKEIGYSEPPLYSRPVAEAWGDACLKAVKLDEARQAFNRDLQERPHSGWALYGIAQSWEAQGDRSEAEKSYGEFLDAWAHADPDLPQIKVAQTFLGNRTGSGQLESGNPLRGRR
jgi:tetratricopeptide (TPR) repeat protein